jgi:SAM-dependent methyltransferase
MSGFQYVGSELELFASATVWKEYLRRQIVPYLGEEVLEVGAGLGGTTRFLCSSGDPKRRWVCLEPDLGMLHTLSGKVENGELPGYCEASPGTLDDLPETERFSSILYIDVLEHIFDDREEVRKAAGHLRPGGRLIVLAPAHPWLFSPFDRAIGHHRRYTRKTLRALKAEGLVEERSRYLDSVGMLASAANRLLLGQSMPDPRQITFWDKVLVRASRLFDGATGYSLGKSILIIWSRTADAAA